MPVDLQRKETSSLPLLRRILELLCLLFHTLHPCPQPLRVHTVSYTPACTALWGQHSTAFPCVHILPRAHPVHTTHPLRSHTLPCIPVCTHPWGHTKYTLYPCVHIPWGHTQYPAPLCAHPSEGTHRTHWTPVCTHSWIHSWGHSLFSWPSSPT